MIYLDNAATSWPKPPSVAEAMTKAVKELGANPGRAGHQMALEAGRGIYRTRVLLAKLFNIKNPLRIAFTQNATYALNLALLGLLQPGDHVITSTLEHNSVARPLYYLSQRGVKVTKIGLNEAGEFDLDLLEKSFQPNTRLVCLTHGSNVSGHILPIEKIGALCRSRQVKFMVDAAQTAGVIPVDVEKMNIDILAFPGHKGLYGPQGTGGLYIAEGIELKPLVTGGTGSHSEYMEQPQVMPDQLESGTPNTPGIFGLGAGVEFVLKTGVEQIHAREQALTEKLLAGLRALPEVIVYGPAEERLPVVSINIKGAETSEVGFILDKVFNIACRTGLHCAPEAHKTLGTFPIGTVRFSPGWFNTDEDIDKTIEAIKTIIKEMKGA
ncbi:aminotransferase class V-fold PLP-dependent enzyme [Carboxydocella sp. ULO1]|uniref:aminotransferase class V-fold PLP-dependent enzyme n=1 Tax=Carboxydocella sp. ULO1 TaxID=1926599 RepID=UPI0009ADCDF8|nr:aminotransferase class V-fold PLP-dependent enzyme [Carboxydocella sp. ULO1]AVX32296.1 cysteine desulfurase family protein [Carboxydocella thermautotrophica]